MISLSMAGAPPNPEEVRFHWGLRYRFDSSPPPPIPSTPARPFWTDAASFPPSFCFPRFPLSKTQKRAPWQ